MGTNFKEAISNFMGSFNASSEKKNDEYARKPEPSPWDNPAIVAAVTEPISDWKWRGMVERGQVTFASEEATERAKADAIAATTGFKAEAQTGGIAAPRTATFKKTP